MSNLPVVGGPGGLDHREDEDDENHDRDKLGHKERRVDLQPAVIFSAVMVQVEGDREKNHSQGNAPTWKRQNEEKVLISFLLFTFFFFFVLAPAPR